MTVFAVLRFCIWLVLLVYLSYTLTPRRRKGRNEAARATALFAVAIGISLIGDLLSEMGVSENHWVHWPIGGISVALLIVGARNLARNGRA